MPSSPTPRTPHFISGYWGKARPADDMGPEWHPLAYHGLDVAAAGEAILKVRPEYLKALSRLSGLDVDLAKRWFLLCLAVHDVGKYAECFQVKYKRLVTHPEPCNRVADPGHGSMGRALWSTDCRPAMPPEAGGFLQFFRPGSEPTEFCAGFGCWMASVFGHHGRPVDEPAATISNLISEASAAHAREYIEACVRLFPVRPPENLEVRNSACFHRSSWLVAGLAILADWIGSNQEWFPYREPDLPLDEYWELAREHAASAILRAGLTRPTVATSFGLEQALASPKTHDARPMPSELQAWALDEFHPHGQTLVVIEDLTGSGKTEAALIAAHRLMHAGAAEGLYWALPTMATANGLYARLARSYESLFEDPDTASLVLAHGKRAFNETFRRSVLPAGRIEPLADAGDDGVTASAQCAAWIADDRRKTFLADVGVGTIDQALLGILPAKHQALRLAALARRVLVIDEVHSFDPYTGRLIERLLEFHAALGGSAILLSATLTGARRSIFTASFAKGAGWKAKRTESKAFPLVTTVTEGGIISESPRVSSRGSRRDLPVRRLESEDEALALLVDRFERGEACVWIRNTVHDAMSAYERLRSTVEGERVDLFHARFALGDRLFHENRALENFGKGSAIGRNRILVATQVVEQSLDLDFDVMVSDLAPMDLLIQRAGRLHRHHRGERPAPVLLILGPEAADDVAATWYPRLFPKGQYVYPDHGQLWRTMRYLAAEKALKLESASPRDPIEAVFGDGATFPKGLEKVSGRAEGEAIAQRGAAALNALELHAGYSRSAGSWESDTITPTRLGAPQRTLRLAKWDGMRLAPWCPDDDPVRAWHLSEVQVLKSRVEAIVYPDKKAEAACKAEIARWPDFYDPPILVPLVTADGESGTCRARNKAGRHSMLCYSPKLGLAVFDQSASG